MPQNCYGNHIKLADEASIMDILASLDIHPDLSLNYYYYEIKFIVPSWSKITV